MPAADVGGVSVPLVLTTDGAVIDSVARRLFPESERRPMAPPALQPCRPFDGPLFEVLASQPGGACLGLVLPLTETAAAPITDGPALVAVADHVNVSLRSPLAGRWPRGVSRSFPAMAGLYQPRVVRLRGGAQVYSAGVVAGVADAGGLTPFESAVVQSRRYDYISDMMVPIAVVAAYYGLKIAACGVVQAGTRDEQRGSLGFRLRHQG